MNIDKNKDYISSFFKGFIRIKGVLRWLEISLIGFFFGISSLSLLEYFFPFLIFLLTSFFGLSFMFAINNYFDLESDCINPRYKKKMYFHSIYSQNKLKLLLFQFSLLCH